MSKEEHTRTKEEIDKDKKITSSAFLIIFPTLVLAGIAAFYAPMAVSIVSVIIAFYQFLMLKKFLEDYYRR